MTERSKALDRVSPGRDASSAAMRGTTAASGTTVTCGVAVRGGTEAAA